MRRCLRWDRRARQVGDWKLGIQGRSHASPCFQLPRLLVSPRGITLATYTVHFTPGDNAVTVPSGSMLSEAAGLAGFDLNQPCGGQGRCGRCAVIVDETRSAVRRRSTIRLSAEDVAAGYALACQTVIEGDAWVTVPPQEAIERRLVTQKSAAKIEVPFDYDPRRHQSIQRYFLRLDPPSLADQTDDWARITRAPGNAGSARPQVALEVMRGMPGVLRGEDDGRGITEEVSRHERRRSRSNTRLDRRFHRGCFAPVRRRLGCRAIALGGDGRGRAG